jgi:hypothetical protein
MTTIRDALGAYTDAEFRAFGIDPDADEHSIFVVQRPKCPTCEGTGEVMVDSASMVGIPGGLMPDRCPTCFGTGYVPPEWATVDGSLDWLMNRGWWFAAPPEKTLTLWRVAFRTPYTDSPPRSLFTTRPTLHAALIAACVAIQEAGQ